jgi:hypothetical protein
MQWRLGIKIHRGCRPGDRGARWSSRSRRVINHADTRAQPCPRKLCMQDLSHYDGASDEIHRGRRPGDQGARWKTKIARSSISLASAMMLDQADSPSNISRIAMASRIKIHRGCRPGDQGARWEVTNPKVTNLTGVRESAEPSGLTMQYLSHCDGASYQDSSRAPSWGPGRPAENKNPHVTNFAGISDDTGASGFSMQDLSQCDGPTVQNLSRTLSWRL